MEGQEFRVKDIEHWLMRLVSMLDLLLRYRSVYRRTLILFGFMIVERASLYGSRNMLDQHRDMRLDIDSMSYE
ncbi:DNA binding zinc finger protein (Pspzf), partial [Trifolium medium]|nr:DNA binding zinc finger protein (Pspzf) [Trifolium medium]